MKNIQIKHKPVAQKCWLLFGFVKYQTLKLEKKDTVAKRLHLEKQMLFQNFQRQNCDQLALHLWGVITYTISI